MLSFVTTNYKISGLTLLQVLRIAPPMILTKNDVDFVLPKLYKCFKKHSTS